MSEQASAFVHCAHSEYSVVDSIIPIKPLFASLKDKGFDQVIIADECNLFATVKIYQTAKANGIKPIFAADLRHSAFGDGDYDRITCVCLNEIGLHALIRLISRAYQEAPVRIDGIPIIPKEWLTQESLSNLVVLSGGLDGALAKAALANNTEQVQSILDFWQNVLPPDHFYLEIHRLGRADEQRMIDAMVDLSQRHDLPLFASNRPRFLKAEDFHAHEVRVCVGRGEVIDDPKRLMATTKAQWLKPIDEMQALFADLPGAIENTVQLAMRANVHLEIGETHLPNFPTPDKSDVDTYMRTLSQQGLVERLKHSHQMVGEDEVVDEQAYQARLDRELDVIIQMGFSGYFLIVADFIQWSKQHDIPVGPGRGSGAGSLVAYVLGITDIDPLPYGLLFERFLNPERVSMPDFDVDFCIAGRDRVIDYVAERYGRESVSQIITYGTMAAKAVVRDVGRVLGHPYGFVDPLAKLIPMDLGITLTDALRDEPQLRARYHDDPEVKILMDTALKLEGRVRNVGRHAGGVVIAPSVLSDFCPVYCEEGSQAWVSQYDKDDIEKIGLVKFDFLGLRNLTIIHDTLVLVNRMRQAQNLDPVVIEDIPLQDEKTFELLKKCQTTAVFQLESRGMKDLIHRLGPDCFEEIIALVALFRPGPLQSGMVDDFIDRKHGRSPVSYPHPDVAECLEPTYGIILYQEQVMQIAQILAGYSLGGADILRRAMGKKKPEEMAKQRDIFVKGALANNIDEKTASSIFDLMEKFAGYGFNKSHSAAYALVAYQTAYLKAHFPSEFMAAVMTSDCDNTDKIQMLVDECQQMELTVQAPDVNKSIYAFSVEHGEVVYGLGAIKGAGEGAIESLMQARESGPFTDLFDLVARADGRKLNKKVLEALVNSGALDGFGQSRAILLVNIADALMAADQKAKAQAAGQSDLFASVAAPETTVVSYKHLDIGESYLERCVREKQALGFYFSGHPVRCWQDELKSIGVRKVGELIASEKNQVCRLGGVISAVRRLKTKQGKLMQILTLDDSQSKQEILMFADTAELYQDLTKVDRFVLVEVEVSVDKFSGGQKMVVQKLAELEEVRIKHAQALEIRLDSEQTQSTALDRLEAVLKPYQGGECALQICYQEEGQLGVKLQSQAPWLLRLEDDCILGIQQYLGMQAVKVIY